MTAETYSLESFIADVDRAAREGDSPGAIADRVAALLGRLVRNPAAVPAEYRRSPAGQRGRYMLHRAPHFNVTAVNWRPGDRAGAHDHQTWGVIGVIENEIEETRYRVTETDPGRARLEVTEVLRHRAGAVSRLVPGAEVHAMHNPTDRDTVEIHVYGQDLVGLRRRTWSADGTERPLVSAKYLNC
ncbi:MAG TPA: cysteine dioxygenase family protein, partial [Methylomirabilota bacterium]|nr:cysteine dioxygenase family protein [Methylomirabilota bacterium]